MSLSDLRKTANETRGRIEAILKTDGELGPDLVSELTDLETRMVETNTAIEREELIARTSALVENVEPTYTPDKRRGNAAAAPREVTDADRWEAVANRALSRLGLEARADDTPLYGYTANGNDGDSLIPVDLQDMLLRIAPNLSAVRNAATVRSFSVDAEIPVVANRASVATIVSEGSAFADVAPEFDRLRVKNFKTATETVFSIEFLADNRGGAMEETMRQHMENHALGWETYYASASPTLGATRVAPEGIRASKTTIDAAFDWAPINDADGAGADLAATATTENLIKVINALPGKFRNGTKHWIMSPAFHAALVGGLDAQDRFAFFAQATGTAQNNPLSVGTALGFPILLSDSMPATYTDGDVACVLLDRESYMIADRSGSMQTQLDPFTGGASGLIKFRSWMRSDGLWTNPARSARLTF